MTVLQPKGYYSRLLPTPARPLSTSYEAKLIKLGEAMRYNVEREATLLLEWGLLTSASLLVTI